ncbi:hypothetical protein ACOSQ2_014649 [Xanthoceras sorbifolium]
MHQSPLCMLYFGVLKLCLCGLYQFSRISSMVMLGENKLNSDASVRPGSGFIGVGAIIRNDTGSVIAALSKPISDDFSMEACELLALREGLLLANMHNLVMNCVEVNAANIASGLNGDDFQ